MLNGEDVSFVYPFRKAIFTLAKRIFQMNISLYTLTSPLHDENAVNAASADFLNEIESELGSHMAFHGPDFTEYGTGGLDVIYVRTGGTEGLFKEVYQHLQGHVLLLTSGKSNSLAASMEILSYLNQQGRRGEIIHGTPAYIAERLRLLSRVHEAKQFLNGRNLGIIGQPSDWLISSDPDREAVKAGLGLNLVDVPIEELVDLVLSDEDLSAYSHAEMEAVAQSIPSAIQKYTNGTLRIYQALKKIIEKYQLSGLTLRCFDLLTAVENTGCLALALLNAEGIPAGCEGDVPTLITMTAGYALTGKCGFQCNPSRIDPQTGELLLAHCTVPLDMISSYTFNTHFESGIGIAVHGEMPEGDATIFKLAADLSRNFVCKATLTGNPYEKSLCRTQITLKLSDSQPCAQSTSGHSICQDYFLSSPIGNHHVVFTGNQCELFDAFCKSIAACRS
jgi:L-fucose isomerase-like protein